MNKKSLKNYSLGVLCLMCALAGCSQDQLANDPTQPPTGKPVEMRLRVDARATIDPETDINRLRMVVIASTGSTDAGQLILNKYYPTPPAGNELKEIITSGMRDVYLIVNEPLGGSGEQLGDYKNIATAADMRNLSVAYQGAGSTGIYTPTEIPMFVEYLNQLITVDGPNVVAATVERVMAKVTLKLNIKNSYFPAGEQAVIDHITIKNLPQSSSLIAQDYTGALVTSEKQTVGVVTAASGYDFSSTNTFYVPEYLFTDPAKGAYIEIRGHINGAPNMTLKYEVKLGDAMDDAKRYGYEYHITRNRHYTFTGDVKSYGEVEIGIAMKVTVTPWNTLDMNSDTGRYVAFTKATDASNNEIADGAILPADGTTLKVVCSTNIGSWYTIMRDEGNVVLDTSAATASVTTAASQTVSIPIPKMAGSNPEQKFTIGIYQSAIAQESVGPVKVFRFKQADSGLIPNSVLIAAGWPADKLPATGLQLAKRGVKIPPSGTAQPDGVEMAWKTEQTLSGITDRGLGMGVSNTAKMAGAKFPPAQYCREMGSEWFLPSIDELALISRNKGMLGPSYQLIEYAYYWSSTEEDAKNSYYVYVVYNAVSTTPKTKMARVRCVKYI